MTDALAGHPSYGDSMTGAMWARYVLLARFVPWLARGWRFSGDIAEPMAGHHGQYSCLMVSEVPA